jgi:diguanylate cyclase (GGDEF)-like protein
MVVDNLVSRDGQAMAVNLYLDTPDGDASFDTRATQAIERLLLPLRAPMETVFQIGAPAIRDRLTHRILHDLGVLLPLSVSVLLVTLALGLRRLSGALIPLLTAGLSVIWTLALMALLGIPVNIMTSVVPALIVVIGSTEDIHLLSEYLGARLRGRSPARSLVLMANNMGLTVTLTFATTYVGFLSIVLNRVELLYQFGLVASSGLLINFIITVLLIPAALRWFPPPVVSSETSGPVPYRAVVLGLLRWVTDHRSLVWYLVALICAVALGWAVQLRVNNNPLDYLGPDSPVNGQVEQVHRDLSGIHTLAVVLDSGIKDTFLQVDYLKELRRIQSELDAMPEIDRTFSFADFIALVNSAMDDTLDDPRALPEDSAIVREYMLFIKHREVAGYVSADFSRAKILVRHNVGSSEQLNAAIDRLRDFIGRSVDPAFERSSPLFRGMSAWQIKKVLLTGDIRRCGQGEVVLRREYRGNDLYIVLRGRVEYRRTQADGSTSVLASRGEGGIFGEESFQTRCDAAADVVAVRDTEVLVFGWDRVHRLSRVFPFVALRLYRNLSVVLGTSLTEARSDIDRPCDDLTGLFSKEFFVGRLEQEMRRAQRYGIPLCFVSLDLRIQDHRGSYSLRQASEEIVQEVTRNLDAMVREVDLVTRWNDGNPAVLLPHTDLPDADRAAQRLLRHLEQATSRYPWRLEASYRCTRLDGLEAEATGAIPATDGV